MVDAIDLSGARPTRVRDIFKPWRVFRSAVTGEFVSRAYALKNPEITVSQTIWR